MRVETRCARDTFLRLSRSSGEEFERKKKDDPAPRIPRDSRENRSTKRDLDSVNPCHQFVVRAFFDPVNPFVSHTRATNSTLNFLRFPSAVINPDHVSTDTSILSHHHLAIRMEFRIGSRNWNEKLERWFRSTSLLHQGWDGGARSLCSICSLSLFLFHRCAARPCLVPSLVSSSNKKMI